MLRVCFSLGIAIRMNIKVLFICFIKVSKFNCVGLNLRLLFFFNKKYYIVVLFYLGTKNPH